MRPSITFARDWSRLSAGNVVLVALLIACGRGGESSADSAELTADSPLVVEMPGMPGMTDTIAASAVVTFTAGQVEHGGVQWTNAVAKTMATMMEVPGQLIPNEDRTARLAASAQARVLAVHVSPGDRVSNGARLVTLQSQEASMAQSDVAKAIAELSSRRAAAAYAKAARDRAERLLALKAIPRQDYERAIADDELARAELAQAGAELDRARSNAAQLGVDPATGTMTLRAPLGGVITTRDVVPGSVVSAGTQLVTVTDPSTLWLAMSIPEASAIGVRQGSIVRFVVASYPADTLSARVQSVSATFDPVTRSLPVRAVVPNPRGRLRPEMYARAWVEGGMRHAVPIVPDSAIQRLDGKPVVFVAHPDGKGGGGVRFEKREIEPGMSTGGLTPVLRGVTAGEAVVVRGAFAVKAEFAKARMPKMEMEK